MKHPWTRTCLTVGLALSIFAGSAAAETAPGYRSYTDHSLIKQDGTYWTWGSLQPVPVQIHGLGNVAAVYNFGRDQDRNGSMYYVNSLIQLADGTVQYADSLKAGQQPQLTALPHLDNLKQVLIRPDLLLVVDGKNRLHLIPNREYSITLSALQSSTPLPGIEDVDQVSIYEEWNGTRYDRMLVVLKTDGSVWRGLTTTQGAELARIPGIEDATKLEGYYALTRNGELHTWNIRTREASVSAGAPAVRVPINKSLRSFDTFYFGNLAVDTEGALWFWGRTVTGVSDGTTLHEQPTPIRFSQLSNVREAYIAERTLFALTEQGELYHTSLYRESMPANAKFELLSDNVRSVEAGGRHIIFEKSDGSLWGWGVNKWAELGVGDFEFMYNRPVQMHKPITVSLNNEPVPLSSGAILRGDQAFIPLRSVFEQLGASLVWNHDTKEVAISRDADAAGDAVQIQIRYNSGEVIMGDQPVTLPAQPFIIQGVSYLPLRFVSEALGAQVHWSAADRSVSIIHPPVSGSR
ncbi:stalk domain-containing protein [Paenibacillus sp. 1P07SE]|uniref:stalk domain-containing protein n=1 Tax=Paenibacillus sp. 1P07SE TaxID=3132209 RepID=UPI0039A6F71F